jgi:hypothetical protein
MSLVKTKLILNQLGIFKILKRTNMTRFKLYTLFTFVFIASHFCGAAQVTKPKSSLLALAKTEMGQLRYAYAIPFLKNGVDCSELGISFDLISITGISSNASELDDSICCKMDFGP